MIKRTLCFSNPAYLSLKDKQLVIKLPEMEKAAMPSFKKDETITIPIEDIGVVVLDNRQITITQGVIEQLLDYNVSIITCDSNRLPTGLLLPLCGNQIQTERFRAQIDTSEPLKKSLWQQTIKAKIINQAALLRSQGIDDRKLMYLADAVKSGDVENCEGRAAAYYWGNIFKRYFSDFTRDRFGMPPNNLLNYGYAILRAICARSLVINGLLPTLGIHHHNRYNSYCLADDIMEPFRPFVDKMVLQILNHHASDIHEITKEHKAQLLEIPVIDVEINKEKSPLMIGMQRTTTSLLQCFEGKIRRIKYPIFI